MNESQSVFLQFVAVLGAILAAAGCFAAALYALETPEDYWGDGDYANRKLARWLFPVAVLFLIGCLVGLYLLLGVEIPKEAK